MKDESSSYDVRPNKITCRRPKFLRVHCLFIDDLRPVKPTFHIRQLNRRLARYDEVDTTLKTNEARCLDRDNKTISCSISTNPMSLFEMIIIKLRYDLIPRRGYVGSSTSSSVTIILSPDFSMIFDL